MKSPLRAQAARFGLEEDLELHGFVSHEEALDLQEQADVLLLVSWNTKKPQGVVTGKFAEYLGARKPIISLVNGDVPGAELTQRMESTNAGIALEDAAGAKDEKRLELYLRDLLSAKLAGEPIPFSPNQAAVARYNYEAITDQMLEVLEEVSERR